MAHVLVIEDERDVAEVIEYNLHLAGFESHAVATAAEGIVFAQRQKPSLILLDLMLPDRPGTEVCRILKASPETRHIPIIMVTACVDEIDRVVGFELGADDYVTKPFSVRELMLRVRRTVERAPRGEHPHVATDEGHILKIDSESHRVWAAGVELSLSALEFRLLERLVSERGKVMTREALLREIWGNSTSVCLRTVDAHIKRLRSRLGAATSCVETVRGVGYRYSPKSDPRREGPVKPDASATIEASDWGGATRVVASR